MNTVVFFVVGMLGQIGVIWLAYSVGHEDGWLDGWDDKRR